MKILINIRKILLILVIIILLTLFGPIIVGKLINSPITEGSSEAFFGQPGNYKVETKVIKNMDDKDEYIVYYPAHMEGTFPMIVWGNGTDAYPKNYDDLHRHLASWGFIIINTYNSQTGTGEPLRDALNYITKENENEKSIFYNHIDMNNIGSAGHSQGSTGAINLQTNYEEGHLIKSIVSIALPSLRWCDPEDVYNTENIQVPFMVLSGTLDFLISPTKTCKEAVNKTKSDIDSWFLLATFSSHIEIEGDGGKYRGIITAWFRSILADDNLAKSMFDEKNGEIFHNSGWKEVYKK